MKEPFKQHGAFSWCELMTSDPEAAKKFYRELLGWETDDYPMEGGVQYTVIKAGGTEIGGMMGLPPEAKGAPPHWGVYVTVDDVDAVSEKAVTMGAKLVVPPKHIPDVGRFAMFRDPQGAMISIITYEKK